MKILKTIGLFVLGIFLVCSKLNVYASEIDYGADVGWLSQLEAQGYSWQDENGNTRDVLDILSDHGITAIRLRVFVNPPSSFEWTKNDGTECNLGYCDTTGLLYMAERAKIRVLI